VRAVAMLQLERRLDNQVSIETRYYISNLVGHAQQIEHVVCSH
jgi:hypothetical protein